MNLRSLFAVAAVAAASLPAHAVVVTQWDFDTLASTYTSPTFVGFAASMGVGAASGSHSGTAFPSTTTAYTSPAGNPNRSISANNWSVGDYWQFSFSTTGYSSVSLTWDQAGSSTGPKDFALSYSVNGSAFSTFANYGVSTSAFNATTPSAAVGYSYDLSTLTALNNAASVVVRLVNTTTVGVGTVASPTAVVGSGGTDRIDNFTVLASPIAAVPEPETYAMLFAGLGVVGFMARRRKA